MFEAWDYYLDRFRDHAVYALLKNRLMGAPLRVYSPFPQYGLPAPPSGEFPWYVADIAKSLKRTERSVSRSLHRLEDKGKVERYMGGWRLKG